MGLFDTIISLTMGDKLFPDNPKLASRLQELERDCGEFLQKDQTLGQELEKEIAQLDERLQAAFRQVRRPELLCPIGEAMPVAPYNRLPKVISPMLNPDVRTNCQLTAAMVRGHNLMIISGLLKFPVVSIGDGLLSCGIPWDRLAVGTNADRVRSILWRDAIKDARAARIRIRVLLESGLRLQQAVRAVQMSYKSLQGIVDESVVLNALVQQIHSQQEDLKAVCEYTLKWLDDYDRIRNSWTQAG